MGKSARLYGDLSWLWPHWEDLEEYRQDSEMFVRLITESSANPVSTLLDMACGGGKHDFWLKRSFQVTGLDLSRNMLSHAARLNPECRYVAGDMRDPGLNEKFDAVFINDGLLHICTLDDLGRVFTSARACLNLDGVMLCTAEVTKETFKQDTTLVSRFSARQKPGDLDVTVIENRYDPDGNDHWFENTLVFLIRRAGKLSVERDTFRCGLFSLDSWRSALSEAGFQVSEHALAHQGQVLTVFTCVNA